MDTGNRLDARDARTLRDALASFGPFFDRLLSPRASGIEHLRARGPALVVGNHSGGQMAMLEPLVFAHAMQSVGIEELPTLLLHDIMWRTPFAGWLEKVGAVRASGPNADGLLDAGKKVLVYPGGDREVFRPFTHRDRVELGDRRGYVKLAITHGVPIIPVVTSGIQSGFVSLTDGHWLAQRLPLARKLRVGVLPVTLSFPFGLSVGIPAPYIPLVSEVRLHALAPIHFPLTGAEAAKDEPYVEACHEHVRTAMQLALEGLADERRQHRREAIARLVDRVLGFFERLTLIPRLPTKLAPLPAIAPVIPLPRRTSPAALPAAA